MIEEYGRFVKQKAKAILSGERARVEPFTTSILDGIDIRETIRNWHRHKIFVKTANRLAGEVGSVVVIFDEDRDDRYTYLTTWLGEHQNESDMAFYSTHPFDNIVGPGIGRAEYGGLLMTLAAVAGCSMCGRTRLRISPSRSLNERLLMALPSGLFGGAFRGVCRRQAAALDFLRSIAAHYVRSQNSVRADWAAVADQTQEAACGARARWPMHGAQKPRSTSGKCAGTKRSIRSAREIGQLFE